MATPLNSFITTVSTLFEATTPPTRTEKPYRRLRGRQLTDGTSADRTFFWQLPNRIGAESEAVGAGGASVVTYVRWGTEVTVRLSAAGQGVDTLPEVAGNELNLLARRIEQYTAWPTGVLTVLVTGTDIGVDDDSDDSLLSISFQVLTAETDGN